MSRKIPIWIGNWIKYIQDFDINYNPSPQLWIRGIPPAKQRKFKILNFNQSGRAIRKIREMLGDDCANYVKTYSGHRLPYRAVVWGFKWKDTDLMRKLLKRAGIKEYMFAITQAGGVINSGYLFIRIPA